MKQKRKNQMKIIDAHIHLFNLAAGQYEWLKSDNAPFWPDKALINKDFTIDDILLPQPYQLTGFVHIEAGFDNQQPWREIAWLESLPLNMNMNKNENKTKDISNSINFSAVAFIDITADEDDFVQQLNQLLKHKSVVGCRYILDEDALQVLQQPSVEKNLSALAKKQLSFDVQMPLDDIITTQALLKLLATIPTLKFIINHAGTPPYNIESNGSVISVEQIKWKNWQQNIQLLSRFDNCFIKCSGWEMAERNYHDDWLKNVFIHCLNCFGQQRLMLASNFPLTLFAKSYHDYWLELINSCTQVLHGNKHFVAPNNAAAVMTAICFENAQRIYKIPTKNA